MKIRINRLQLMQGVKTKIIICDNIFTSKAVTFCYYENIFYIIDHFDGGNVYKFKSYQSFRVKLSDITKDL
jgi:hypothetical protein